MKPTKNIIDIYLGILSNLNQKLEYLYEQERKIKESANNPLSNGLSSNDKALLDTVQAKIKRYKKELESNESNSGGKIDHVPKSNLFSKDHIYRFFNQLKNEKDLSREEAHQKVQEVLRSNGLEPSENHVNENFETFNRTVNQYFTRKRNKNS
jgi:hypothetical protein